ncbi:MAG: HAD family hydrolase [Dehalococcoidia bacterium]
MSTARPASRIESRIETVLFDLDDTLTDAAQFGSSTLVHAAAAHGHRLDLDVVKQHPGAPYIPLLQRLLGLEQGEATEVYATYVRRYGETMQHELQEHAGASDLLQALVLRDTRLGLVTNKLERLALQIIGLYGWDRHFGVVVGQDSCAYRKPHPGIALHALEALQGRPETTAFVGDTPGDMQCARAAGLGTVIGLASTTPTEVLTEAGATVVCTDLGEVRRLLEG